VSDRTGADGPASKLEEFSIITTFSIANLIRQVSHFGSNRSLHAAMMRVEPGSAKVKASTRIRSNQALFGWQGLETKTH
jgi:hypothetical protein